MIGFGEHLFGIDNSFGWRFASAVVRHPVHPDGRRGSARRLFGSTLLGCIDARPRHPDDASGPIDEGRDIAVADHAEVEAGHEFTFRASLRGPAASFGPELVR